LKSEFCVCPETGQRTLCPVESIESGIITLVCGERIVGFGRKLASECVQGRDRSKEEPPSVGEPSLVEVARHEEAVQTHNESIEHWLRIE